MYISTLCISKFLYQFTIHLERNRLSDYRDVFVLFFPYSKFADDVALLVLALHHIFVNDQPL